MKKILEKMNEGKSFILISHDLGTVLSFCSRCLLLDKGKIVYDIKNNFFLKYQTDGEIEMDLKMKEISLKMKSKNTFIQDVIISKK